MASTRANTPGAIVPKLSGSVTAWDTGAFLAFPSEVEPKTEKKDRLLILRFESIHSEMSPAWHHVIGVFWSTPLEQFLQVVEKSGAGDGNRTRDVQLGKLTVD